MKIGIFAFPRTSSTALCMRIGASMNLAVYIEPLTNRPVAYKQSYVTGVINPMKSGVIKFMNHAFSDFDYQSVDWSSFDKIIFVERRNTALSCVSTYVASTNNVWHNLAAVQPRDRVMEDVTRDHVINFATDLNTFYSTHKPGVSGLVDNMTVYYEDLDTYGDSVAKFLGLTGPLSDNIPTVPTGIDYAKLCPNYDQVVGWMNEIFNQGNK